MAKSDQHQSSISQLLRSTAGGDELASAPRTPQPPVNELWDFEQDWNSVGRGSASQSMRKQTTQSKQELASYGDRSEVSSKTNSIQKGREYASKAISDQTLKSQEEQKIASSKGQAEVQNSRVSESPSKSSRSSHRSQSEK